MALDHRPFQPSGMSMSQAAKGMKAMEGGLIQLQKAIRKQEDELLMAEYYQNQGWNEISPKASGGWLIPEAWQTGIQPNNSPYYTEQSIKIVGPELTLQEPTPMEWLRSQVEETCALGASFA